jgi:sugar phosphate isomerase/epimerase
MQLALPGRPHLTYCTNIHGGESWAEIEASLARHLPGVKRQVSPGAPMGVGLRLSGAAARQLTGEETRLAAFQDFLAANQLYVFSINAFPYGAFHGRKVKEQVYEPDWRTQERLAFTNDAADILARLLPDGVDGSVSTVPGAFKSRVRTSSDIALMAETMVRHAAHLDAIAAATGKVVVLALEPEPCCLLETTEEAIDFFKEHLFGDSAIGLMRLLRNLPAAAARDALRRHLGLCFDVCHAAVEFEEIGTSLSRLRAAGIRVAKLQLSSAIRVPAADSGTEALLARFDDGIYLHQAVERRDGGLARYADLPEALAALRAGGRGSEWRVHCHVPVFLDDLGGLSSTQEVLLEALALCRANEVSPHLEIETYTWSVLPETLRHGDIGVDIAREVEWVRSQLRA